MASMEAKPPLRPVKVLSVGMGRTGSYSMSLALKILGYKDVFHAIDAIDTPEFWFAIQRAADATFTTLPSYTGQPFTRSQWDEIFGPCEAITDIAGPFATALIKAYPEAKVVLVHRDFDKWWRSVDETLLPTMWGLGPEFFSRYLEPIVGSCMIVAGRKMMLGWARARDVDELRKSAKMAIERHEEEIMRMVASGRLLYYQMGDGWEPLCSFLGMNVPDAPFPHANERDALKKVLLDKQKRIVMDAGAKVLPYMAGIVGVAIAAWSVWYASSKV